MYKLSEALEFPHPSCAGEDGFLAWGGDLSPQRLLLAYANGIFPWYNQGEPICWWSPDPRMLLFPENLKVSKSMRKIQQRKLFDIRYDTDFDAVIEACAEIAREGQGGTWITEEMKAAYKELHRLGYAHSVEAYQGDELVGGLYGVSLGKCFFGESMFAKVSNASKAAFIHLVQRLQAKDFWLIDCQVHTAHLESLGASLYPQELFLEYLQRNREETSWRGNWQT